MFDGLAVINLIYLFKFDTVDFNDNAKKFYAHEYYYYSSY